MGSFDRSKKRIQLWKKAMIHFSLCFVMGFFTGFAPTSTSSFFSSQLAAYQPIKNLGIQPQPIEALQKPENFNRSLLADEVTLNSTRVLEEVELEEDPDEEEDAEVIHTLPDVEKQRGLLIVVTTTRSGETSHEPSLRRLSHTMRLVPPPLLWVLVEGVDEAPKTAKFLRQTGIMYRHLTFKENFTDFAAEADHQRNVALNHIEHHRLTGIVHFASPENVYDMQFFQEIRDIEVFGVWPVAMLSANRKRVVVEGPICSSSQVLGWRQEDFSSGSAVNMRIKSANSEIIYSDQNTETRTTVINISGFAFNSSILWDPERWGRPSSDPDISQDAIKFVQQVVLEDESKLRGLPSDCSKIMLWHIHQPKNISSHQQNQDRRR